MLRINLTIGWCIILCCMPPVGPQAVGQESSDAELSIPFTVSRMLIEFIDGHESDLKAILDGPPDLVVEIRAILSVHHSDAQLGKLIANLQSKSYSERESSSQVLKFCNNQTILKINDALKAVRDPESKYRLSRILSQGSEYVRRTQILADSIPKLYTIHCSEFAPNYLERLVLNCYDPAASEFFEFVPSYLIWGSAREMSKQVQVRYLLHLCRFHPDDNLPESALQQFAPADVLDQIEETYWPSTVQPFVTDGSQWSIRAEHFQGNRATSVATIIIYEATLNTKEHVGVVADNRWDYLFRFEEPFLGMYEGIALKDGSPSHVHIIPPGVDVPTVSMSKDEQMAWAGGANYLWARALYPNDLVGDLNFIESPHQPNAKIKHPGVQ